MLRLFATILLAGAALCQAAESAAGRWEGVAQIPGNELRLVVDLSDEGGKGWTGSITIPGLSVKGAELVDLHVRGGDLDFSIKGALGNERSGRAELKAHLTSDGHLAGDFKQGGNSAPFVLTKTGAAQVDLPARSTALAKELEGEWKGDYEMTGYTRHATMKFASHGTEAIPVEFTIVGKKVNNVPVSLVTQEGDFVTVKSEEFGITFEGRFSKEAREIKGTLSQGPLEAPLVLRKTP
ncbi:MAG TPA: hypothetical protein VE031_03860 [Chthoniobacterales bacterium]|nr:hypothetical protein [Chthoniobacterales bacterium]